MSSSLNQRLDDDLYNAYNRFDDALGLVWLPPKDEASNKIKVVHHQSNT